MLKKYSIILIVPWGTIMLLLSKGKLTPYHSLKQELPLLLVYQTELLLIGLILITSIIALNISKTNPRLYSQSMETKPVKISNKNSLDALELRYATRLASVVAKMLMNICWITAAVCLVALLAKLSPFLWKML